MVVLQEAPNALNLVAPDCSSFTVVSRGTSMRTPINPLGRDGIAFVHSANGSVSRLGLIKNHGILWDFNMHIPYINQWGPRNNIPDAGWFYYCFSWWPATLYGAWSSPKVARRCCLDTRDLNGCATMFSMTFSCIQLTLYFTHTCMYIIYIYIYIYAYN